MRIKTLSVIFALMATPALASSNESLLIDTLAQQGMTVETMELLGDVVRVQAIDSRGSRQVMAFDRTTLNPVTLAASERLESGDDESDLRDRRRDRDDNHPKRRN